MRRPSLSDQDVCRWPGVPGRVVTSLLLPEILAVIFGHGLVEDNPALRFSKLSTHCTGIAHATGTVGVRSGSPHGRRGTYRRAGHRICAASRSWIRHTALGMPLPAGHTCSSSLLRQASFILSVTRASGDLGTLSVGRGGERCCYDWVPYPLCLWMLLARSPLGWELIKVLRRGRIR
jgi:hypothetical protein